MKASFDKLRNRAFNKRFILMLLVMLGSMSGAWADQVEFNYSTKFSYNVEQDYYYEQVNMATASKRDMSNKFFRVVVNNASFYVLSQKVKSDICDVSGLIYATNFTVTNLDAAHVSIQQILVTKYDNNQLEFSYPIGNSDATFQLSSDGSEVIIVKIKIVYTSNHEHAMTEWRHNDNVHWQECEGDGICTEDDNHHFNQANHTYSDDRNQGAAYYTCTTCGYVNEKRTHEHVADGAWLSDATQHWHVCIGTIGQCETNGKTDIADHTYGGISVDDATAYYTCDICGYVNNTRKAEYDALDFLSMKAVDAAMTIGMAKTGSPADYDLQYSLDRTHWTTVTLTATNSNIVEIPDGQTCYFRHGTETVLNKLSNNQSNLWTFTMTGDGSVEAGGNVMSLLDITCQKNTMSQSHQHVFNSLFKGCAKLTKAPKLPATSLGEYCYCSMFEDTSITEVPKLPATSVRTGSYLSMFKDCKQLTSITGGNVLSFTSLAGRACKEMFKGCEKLTSVTLNNITSIDSRNNSDGSFYNWLEGTAIDEEGVLIAPDALVANPLIFLPQNWMFKQIKDYTTAVSNATEGTTSVIQNIGEDYITQIKQATSNASALSLRDEALSDINTLIKYNSKFDASSFAQPTGSGMRLKITKKDNKVYEFKTQDVKSVDYYRANE